MTTLGMSGGMQQMRILAAQLASNSLDALRRWVNDPQIYNFFQRVSQSSNPRPGGRQVHPEAGCVCGGNVRTQASGQGDSGAQHAKPWKSYWPVTHRTWPLMWLRTSRSLLTIRCTIKRRMLLLNCCRTKIWAGNWPAADQGSKRRGPRQLDGIRFASYQTLMKRLNTNIQNAVMRICGGKHLPVAEVAAQLRQIGLPVLFNDSVPAAMNSAFDLSLCKVTWHWTSRFQKLANGWS